MLISEDELFGHLRVDFPDHREIAAVVLYESAAWDYIAAFTNCEWRADGVQVPAALKAAALLLVADMYENREAQTATALHQNKAADRLLWPHRQF